MSGVAKVHDSRPMADAVSVSVCLFQASCCGSLASFHILKTDMTHSSVSNARFRVRFGNSKLTHYFFLTIQWYRGVRYQAWHILSPWLEGVSLILDRYYLGPNNFLSWVRDNMMQYNPQVKRVEVILSVGTLCLSPLLFTINSTREF